jgi:hypothetical protein
MSGDLHELQTLVTANIPGLDSGDDTESDVLHAYVRQLLTDYLLVPPGTGDPIARSMIDDLMRTHSSPDGKPRPAWTWDDVYAIEKALARIEPIERVRRRVVAARQEFRELAGQRAYEGYVALAPPDPAKASEDEVRSDLLQLLAEVQWLYATVGVQHGVRNRLLRNLAIGSLFLVGVPAAVTIAAIFVAHRDFSIPGLVIVMMCGALGGLVSTYRRVYGLPLDGNPAVNLVVLDRSKALIYLSPAIGAVFAAVFYVLLISGLVSGELFPAVDTPGPSEGATTVTFAEFVTLTAPRAGVDIAKLMVWSFIAGFAERLVPDTIERLSASSSGDGGK